MKQGNSYRLLQLKQIFSEETDEFHQLDVYELKQRLMQVLDVDNIDVRTIKQDIIALEEMGFDIVKNRRRHGKIYYSHQARAFETYQLRLLVDAVLSARFITLNEKITIIEEIKQLTSKPIAKSLPEPVMYNQTVNKDYEMIKHNIDRIHLGIANNHVLQFKYGQYTVTKEFVFRKEGKAYLVAPYGLIWQDDFYYVIGYSYENEEIRHYRVDRMRQIEETNTTFTIDPTFDLQKHTSKSVNMFAGDDQLIVVRFSNELVNVVLDQFGLHADITPDGDEHFILKRHTKISNGLLTWLLSWGAKAKVLAPDTLVQMVAHEVNAMYESYGQEEEG